MGLLARWWIRLSVPAALFLLFIHATPFTATYARWLSGDWTDAEGDYLIVLANEQQADGIIGGSTYWRVVYAVRAWRKGHFQYIVVSGANGGGGVPMAVNMRDFLVSQGVPADRVLLETAARSTRENALFVTRLLAGRPGKKVLLSSDLHTYRAHRAFLKAGLTDIVPRPFPDTIKQSSNWTNRWNCFLGLASETIKIGYYRAKGWI